MVAGTYGGDQRSTFFAALCCVLMLAGCGHGGIIRPDNHGAVGSRDTIWPSPERVPVSTNGAGVVVLDGGVRGGF